MAAGKFAFTGSGELRVSSGGRTLAAAGDVIAIGDRVFRLGEVDRVAYHAAARLHRASYSLGLASGLVRCRFGFDAAPGELDDARETWRRLVELVESAACPRIASTMAEAITVGGTARFGGGGQPRIDADMRRAARAPVLRREGAVGPGAGQRPAGGAGARVDRRPGTRARHGDGGLERRRSATGRRDHGVPGKRITGKPLITMSGECSGNAHGIADSLSVLSHLPGRSEIYAKLSCESGTWAPPASSLSGEEVCADTGKPREGWGGSTRGHGLAAGRPRTGAGVRTPGAG